MENRITPIIIITSHISRCQFQIFDGKETVLTGVNPLAEAGGDYMVLLGNTVNHCLDYCKANSLAAEIEFIRG